MFQLNSQAGGLPCGERTASEVQVCTPGAWSPGRPHVASGSRRTAGRCLRPAQKFGARGRTGSELPAAPKGDDPFPSPGAGIGGGGAGAGAAAFSGSALGDRPLLLHPGPSATSAASARRVPPPGPEDPQPLAGRPQAAAPRPPRA